MTYVQLIVIRRFEYCKFNIAEWRGVTSPMTPFRLVPVRSICLTDTTQSDKKWF